MILVASRCGFFWHFFKFLSCVGAVIPDNIGIIKMWEDERFVHIPKTGNQHACFVYGGSNVCVPSAVVL